MLPGTSRRNALLVSAALVLPTPFLVAVPAHAAPPVYTQVTGGNGQFDSFTVGPVRTDGTTFFSTDEKITVEDQDFSSDVYRRTGSTVTLASPGTADSAVFVAASTDGTALLYRTTASVLPSDTDGGKSDIYRQAGSTTTLMTAGADPTENVTEAAANPTADKIVYYTGSTSKKYVVSSADGSPAVSTPALANATFGAAAPDLSRFWFTTSTSLPGNTDTGADDVYEFTTATQASQLVSLGNSNAAAFADVSADGSHVFWTTASNVGGDTDGFQDVYDTHAGTKTLVSGGTTSHATYFDSTPDGSAVFYTTKAAIDGADTDAGSDVYRRAAGIDTLMTPNGADTTESFPDGISADGSRLAFETLAALSVSDTDSTNDVYLSTGAAPGLKTLVSGTGAYPASFFGQTADLDLVYVATDDKLLASDADPWQDIYAGHPDGSIELVSIDTDGNNAGFGGASADGNHVLIGTYERLTASDTDNYLDVYDLSEPAPTPPDSTAPFASVTGKSPQKNNGKIKVKVQCLPSEACLVSTTGTLKVGSTTFQTKGKPATATIATGKQAALKLTLAKKARTAAAAALQAGKKVKGRVTVVVSDATGNERTVVFKFRLK